ARALARAGAPVAEDLEAGAADPEAEPGTAGTAETGAAAEEGSEAAACAEPLAMTGRRERGAAGDRRHERDRGDDEDRPLERLNHPDHLQVVGFPIPGATADNAKDAT